MLICLPLILSLFAPVPSHKTGVTKIKKSKVAHQVEKSKRTVKRRRDNIKRSGTRTQALRRSTRQQNSNAINNKKNKSNRVSNRKNNKHTQTHKHSDVKRSNSSKKPVPRPSPKAKFILLWQLDVLRADPELHFNNTP